MALVAFSGVVLPEAISALTSLNTRPVSGPSNWSIASAVTDWKESTCFFIIDLFDRFRVERGSGPTSQSHPCLIKDAICWASARLRET